MILCLTEPLMEEIASSPIFRIKRWSGINDCSIAISPDERLNNRFVQKPPDLSTNFIAASYVAGKFGVFIDIQVISFDEDVRLFVQRTTEGKMH